eukprot:TRINITY_DN1317_c0_g1_i4.p1 TRINITY_DN1317_c0_g1~~TRINITY_DN1317_c0_g1_i4.p1  ORF type:complete len:286 (-),score=59.49 TRINITY_DN1317_c0_g1_i4:41-898(-)
MEMWLLFWLVMWCPEQSNWIVSPLFFAEQVQVRMYGKEATRVRTTEHVTERRSDGTTHTRVVHHNHYSSREFLRAIIVVWSFNQELFPGHYSVPFSFVLPTTIPGSFHFTSIDADAEVRYKIKGKIKVSGLSDVETDEVPVSVNEKFEGMVNPLHGENSKSFTFTSGKLNSRVWLDKSVYFPGESGSVVFKANNTSLKKINNVVAKIYQYIDVKAGGHSRMVKNKLFEVKLYGFDPFFYGIRYFRVPVPISLPLNSTKAVFCSQKYQMSIVCDIPNAFDLSLIHI